MSDKSFKVKTGLQIPGVTSASILSTDSSGNVSSTSVLGVSSGGTGQTSANNALNAFLPLQSGGTINYVLQSNGTDTAWGKLYNQTIKNDGTTVTPRGIVNIIGATFADSSGSDTTTITFPSNAYLRQSFTPTSGQTTFTLSSAAIVGSEQVFLNGILLVKGSDYTTPDTTTIELASGATSGDALEVMLLSSIGSSGVLSSYKKEINTAVSSDITMTAGYRYFVNTSAARTLTLPASPSLGDEITIFDASGTASTNNITINSNSGKINGTVQDAIIDIDAGFNILVYTGSTYGWRFI